MGDSHGEEIQKYNMIYYEIAFEILEGNCDTYHKKNNVKMDNLCYRVDTFCINYSVKSL